ncbi:MAG: peptide deformylase [Aristaeellaceae bacterium]
MVRPIMRDPLFLSRPSDGAAPADRAVITDLLDTLRAHQAECVGMAANMIGVRKRIIAVSMGPVNVAMVNPVILRSSGPYEAEEGCLSLPGKRKTTRYQEIELSFQDADFRPRRQVYTGWIAQIIQHEIDHCNGILI